MWPPKPGYILSVFKRKYSPTSNIQGIEQLDNHHMATVTEASGFR